MSDSKVRLSAPRLRVVFADGAVVEEVQCINFDMVMWERTRDKQKPKWPTMEEAPVLWVTFMAFQACRRLGEIPTDFTWERFEREAIGVTPVTDPDESEADESGTPIQPGVDPG